MSIPVRVRRLAHNQDLPLPGYATDGAAGMDLLAAVPAGTSGGCSRSAPLLIPTGFVA